ncbi:hypothetical protein LX97_02120 [Nonlabens dokdonensis]|jgi:hypothetical protein|uniref:PsbP C-terminal domain-containing protein n=2 Tax=Nonlabens dokdonensis TaxID=328515 RepID=L7W7N1_NONDD|nr:hypothetical protein [Nonlabens dokdonensis]AGC77700.1 hypothetical protein DDD_2573 [Nonlabens dokdonensis DSW-6]PZX39763.1 hypothetical protein LX97_02120 [Nonlabens dokdonensis]
MRFFYITAILLFTTLQVNAQEWEVYKNETLQFRADFPNTPKKTVEKVDTAVGTLDMHMVMYAPESGDDNAVYSIIRSDYPAEQFANATDEKIKSVLDGAVEGARSNLNGELVYDKSVKFNGYASRNVKIEIAGAFVYLNTTLVNNSMFITQVICMTDNDNNTSIKRFQDSFEIIKTKQ